MAVIFAFHVQRMSFVHETRLNILEEATAAEIHGLCASLIYSNGLPTLTLRDFIFSNATQHRRIRHLTFWILFGIEYYGQSIVSVDKPFYTALFSFLGFFPACIISVYFFLSVLLPLGKQKRYAALVLALLSITIGVLFINYFGAVFFFFGTCNCDTSQVDRLQLIALDTTNSLHAITTAGLVVGFSVTKGWLEEQRENEELLRLKVTRELNLQRTKLQPQFMLESLKQLRHKLDSGSTEAPAMILKLSEVLSYLLYDSSDETIPLSTEIEMMENLLYLEHMRSDRRMSVELKIAVNPEGLFVKPLSMFSALRNYLDSVPTRHAGPSKIKFEVTHTRHGLSLEKLQVS